LYYRLNVLPLEVPPLRTREGDVAELVPFFLDYFASVHGRKQKKISPKALGVLAKYEWPGNVRELKNIVERMVIMVPGDAISIDDIPPVVLQAVGQAPDEPGPPADGAGVVDLSATYRDAKDSFEKAYLRAQLEANGWNISKTAEKIRLERSNLHKKIKQLKIENS
ncbi:MAG: helix-turn-helix domain-containing protein, partial [bacterium]